MEQFNPTQQMIDARLNGIAVARAAAEQIIKAARAAHDAIVDLPAENEHGQPIMHGANRAMLHTRDYLMATFDSLFYMVGRDFHDLLKFKHKFAAVDGARFHSDEAWAEKCSHLDGEIARLQKLVDEGRDT